ncbi:hypothetical protein [Mesorhizobium sp.]|uniref:hypothetical protein n=1 Tax=Mesorhizobium sp. TaxID=1871066 RepID=UPI000FE7F2B6|nr:hypothetical protein [Mesorhizobium sp.]RWK03143.1 MAG: nitroreductase family deazaflavin-dependent oxidoreductase [Mesorhizobium sp.]TIQ43746.1 MAG: nitroreductase family deazaflavin-dependent oxidoreductase [Mesorhizobium sp.]TIQ53768.1 MAG: nitroreductase family deazaflavin-dependent oxidoreductase [Mesorhizobium sp.]
MSHPSGGHAKSGRRPPDPAEQGWLRWYYRNWRPTLLGRISNSIWAWLTSLGLLPPALLTLQVADRRDGRMRSTVLAVVEHERNRYLVSMLGDTSEWVKNIRVAGGRAFIKRGSAIEVRLTEIPNEDRAPILRAWCQIATSGRRHLPVPYDAPVEAFEAISLDYPVFRIDPAPMPVADSRKQ